jgi:hypothetical protein
MSWTTVRAQTRPPRPRSRQTALTPSEVVFTLSGVETRLEFEDEIPIPLGNLGLYRRIYVLEQWLRRFAMAALMSKYATQWRSAIPTEFGEELRRRRKQLGSRTYLDVESNDTSCGC